MVPSESSPEIAVMPESVFAKFQKGKGKYNIDAFFVSTFNLFDTKIVGDV